MIKIFLSLSILSFSLLGCKTAAPVEEGEATESSASVDGKLLYAKNCSSCHYPLERSERIDATAEEIKFALNNIARMRTIDLSDREIIEISKALSSSLNQIIRPSITSAAPSGRYPGATTHLDLQVTTDIPSTCYYSSLDVSIEDMSDQMYSSAGSLLHQRRVYLSSGASYSYYVHCRDLTNGQTTSVSQYIAFTTDLDAVDTTAPILSGLYNPGTIFGGSTKTKIYLNTNENSQCRYSANSSDGYNQMSTMSTTGTLGHAHIVEGLSNGGSFTYYVMCADPTGNISNKETINFSVANVADGGLIYAQYCVSCHGGLSNSGVRGASAQDISDAIRDIGRMQSEYLEMMSQEQLEALADVL